MPLPYLDLRTRGGDKVSGIDHSIPLRPRNLRTEGAGAHDIQQRDCCCISDIWQVALHSQSIGTLLFQDGLLLWHRDLLIVTVDGLVPIEHRPVDFLSRTGEQKVRGALASSHQSTRSPVPTKHDSP